ncbi:MAG TPA: hypothetical protein VG225_05960 [Terracidiphilus sp.]|jgi:hypothetical protein|nr:hypothetical protein [Terracidiphilus sp.]
MKVGFDTPSPRPLPNGSAAAGILAAGIGSFVLAVLSILGDQSAAIHSLLTFSAATGVLSGVSTVTVILWLAVWVALEMRWRHRTVAAGRVCAISCVLLALALLLTFPPIADLF